MKTKKQNVLLPDYITPTNYDIYLAPDLENFTFEGEETIAINIAKSVSKITVHTAEIEIFSVVFTGREQLIATKIEYDSEGETATFTFSKAISIQKKGKLFIKFAGVLNNKMRGFYRSRYEHKGKTYHMGVTQFESTDARRAFPCFDEPAHKATFDVRLRVPNDRTVISNTLEEETVEHDAGYKVVRFEKSPKMSSYLLAFIIGHFEYVEKITNEGVTVRVYVTPGKKKQAAFALEVSARLMDFYHDYFGIEYPMKTMDLIAIPDFANGAMENWGAVTYRETALLVDPENSSLHTKQWVALIIAHELAHQWFGNLVTMKWWTHLWLNEGFASFMEYLAVDKLFPEWKIWTQFVFTEQAKALSLDGLENTHSIEIPVHHPGEISEIFDAVSYSKGASVIRMIEAYVGENNFKKGLQKYLKRHKYSNAETEDLWRALEEVSKKPVGKIMKNWTGTPGYPLITVESNGVKIMLSQKRFYGAGEGEGKKAQDWLVPFSILTDKEKTSSVLIDKKKAVVQLSNEAVWIKGNANDTSFVRVKYASRDLEKLEDAIRNNDTQLSEEGRFALVRDAFALVEAGMMGADEALRLSEAYKKEKSYIVWAEIVLHLMELNNLLHGENCHDVFKAFGRSLLAEIVSHAGWKKRTGESHEETLLRSTVTFAIGSLGDKETIKSARELFGAMINNKKIDSDLKSLVFSLVAENGGKKEFDIFENIYMTAPSEEEKDRALRAMTSFKDEELLRKTLQIAFSPDVRSQDAFKAVALMSGNPYGIAIAWEYVKEEWSSIVEKFAGGHLFARFISPFSKFKTKKQADELEKFFKKNKAPGIERTVAQAVEKIRSNDALLRRDIRRIELFLKN